MCCRDDRFDIEARRDRDRLRAALDYIRDNEGKVCAEFETCAHPACQSSVAAWFAADAALRDRWEEFVAQGARNALSNPTATTSEAE